MALGMLTFGHHHQQHHHGHHRPRLCHHAPSGNRGSGIGRRRWYCGFL